MICFPTAKINLGLQVLEKRPDKYHEIASVMAPIAWFDALEFNVSDHYKLILHGKTENVEAKENLVTKVWKLLKDVFDIPPLEIHLFKSIPTGAGLGGASADAAFFIKKVNEEFHLKMGITEMKNIAGKLGSDCPFFIENNCSLVEGKGEIFSPFDLKLDNLYLIIINPGIHVSTAKMYQFIKPKKPEFRLLDIVSQPVQLWKNNLKNDFEDLVFNLHPTLGIIKEKLYEHGAVYASMSGSGSAIYGIFEKEFTTPLVFSNYEIKAGFLFQNKKI